MEFERASIDYQSQCITAQQQLVSNVGNGEQNIRRGTTATRRNNCYFSHLSVISNHFGAHSPITRPRLSSPLQWPLWAVETLVFRMSWARRGLGKCISRCEHNSGRSDKSRIKCQSKTKCGSRSRWGRKSRWKSRVTWESRGRNGLIVEASTVYATVTWIL